MASGTIAEWCIKEGAAFNAGDVMAKIETGACIAAARVQCVSAPRTLLDAHTPLLLPRRQGDCRL